MTFEKWRSEAKTELGRRGVDDDTAESLLQEARSYHQDSGLSATEALGEPAEFATDAAGPPDGRADTQNLTAAEHVLGAAATLVFLGFVVTAVRALFGADPQFIASPASLTGGTLLVTAGMLFVAGSDALRAAGRPRWATWCIPVSAVLLIAGVVLRARLPKNELFSLSAGPILLLLLLTGGLLAFFIVRERRQRQDPSEPEAWFAQLEGLLVGRHDLPRDRAADLAAEARAHIAAVGSDPQAEFGSLNSYAQSLADSLPDRSLPWWRRPGPSLVANLLFAAMGAVLLAGYWSDGETWRLILPIGMIVISGRLAFGAYRKL
ncbi:hypothetical protein [Kineosporia babensis]|uniref:Uncharacterized protein n=1 Tax=Kineosporia babensis TaxID=499548 RepID=A0A9X1N936_9ACTN|nr:hypothetical protein [Kineosporia babensis]MCD5309435.1 hypothetical protein [Kineosporia babensis]